MALIVPNQKIAAVVNPTQKIPQPVRTVVKPVASTTDLEKIKKDWIHLGAGLFIHKSAEYTIQDIPRDLGFKMINMTADDSEVDINKYFPEIMDFVSTTVTTDLPVKTRKPVKLHLSCNNKEEMVGTVSFSDSGSNIRLSVNVTSSQASFMIFPLSIFTRKTLTTSMTNETTYYEVDTVAVDQDYVHFIPSSALMTLAFSKELTINATGYFQSIDETEMVKANLNLNDFYTLWASIDLKKFI